MQTIYSFCVDLFLEKKISAANDMDYNENSSNSNKSSSENFDIGCIDCGVDVNKICAFDNVANNNDLKIIYKIISTILDTSYENIFFNVHKIFLTQLQIERIVQLFNRYKNGEPISKILNKNFFWKHEFYVDENVLDPRFDTETVLYAILSKFGKKKQYSVLELGVGSGCVLFSLLYELENSFGFGVDICPKALKIARKNLQMMQLEKRCVLLQSDLFDIFDSSDKNEILVKIFDSSDKIIDNFLSKGFDIKFDIIISNPPYIRTNDIPSLDKSVKNYDPILALDGGFDGLDFYRKIAVKFSQYLNENGSIFLEIGFDQYESVCDIFSNLKGAYHDEGGFTRVLEFGKQNFSL